MNWTALIIILVILAAPFLWAISIYNGLVALRNRFKNILQDKAQTGARSSFGLLRERHARGPT